jgi:hypothetical protein
MTSPSPDLRFGIRVGTKRSYSWGVRSGAKKPELFVERENLPPTVHLSLHASGQWHMKVRRRKVHHWIKPAELTPGYTRALAIVQPVVVAVFTLPALPDTQLLSQPADAEPTRFDLWIERPGANLQGWPGKNVDRTQLVGRIPLAGGAGTCCVVSRQTHLTPGSATLELPTDEQLAWMQTRAAEGRLYGTMVGSLSDGTLALVDGRFDSAAADALASLRDQFQQPPPTLD